MEKDLDFTENPVGSLNSMMTDHKNIRERAADGSIVNGWNATQVDILSEDWVLVDPNE